MASPPRHTHGNLSPGPSHGGVSTAPILDDDLPTDTTLPLPMSASIMLSSLPNNASTALARAQDGVSASEGVGGKVKIRLHALPRAPVLAQKVFKCNASNRFESVVVFLRKRLGLRADEGVVCYVNSVFAPGLDEGVGGLWKCFKQGSGGDEVLVVAYSLTPAFG